MVGKAFLQRILAAPRHRESETAPKGVDSAPDKTLLVGRPRNAHKKHHVSKEKRRPSKQTCVTESSKDTTGDDASGTAQVALVEDVGEPVVARDPSLPPTAAVLPAIDDVVDPPLVAAAPENASTTAPVDRGTKSSVIERDAELETKAPLAHGPPGADASLIPATFETAFHSAADAIEAAWHQALTLFQGDAVVCDEEGGSDEDESDDEDEDQPSESTFPIGHSALQRFAPLVACSD